MKSNKVLKLNSVYFHLFIGILFLLKIPLDAACQDTFLNNKPYNDSITNNRILEERFIKINGIDQWVTIKGERSEPVILFLHGGPGSPLSPYADAIYGGWEKDFIIVQWDQRGSGKTFGRNAPAELSPDYLKSNPLTVEQMTTDGIELVEYLIKYLGKQKVILFGTSWGSVPAVLMTVKRPDLFYAYVGHSQIVNPSDNLIQVYKKVYQMAQSANDKKSIDALNSIGTPPYDHAKNTGQLLRVIKKYERENSIPAPDSLWKISSKYDNEKDNQHRADGDDYSFINYAGDKLFGIKPMISTINLLKNNLDFKIPVYLIQGEEDILTSKEFTKEYFDKIRAPKKEYILLPKSAHGFNQLVVETQYKIMKEYLLPMAIVR
ncbi:MAG: alpha/beta hydrolase [Bacteroidota bacterium]|nr:alpha/beta hydrolase [Bacteroidota bacterium]